jgi:hypothetical protein
MSITAKYSATCSACKGHISPGEKIEWIKGQPVRHVTCGASVAPTGRTGRCACGKAIDPKYTRCYGCAHPGERKRGARYCEGWGADNPHAPRPPYTCMDCE